MDVIKGSVSKMNVKLTNLGTIVDNISAMANNNSQEIRNINYKLDEFEQYSRRRNMRFFGIAEQNGENTDKVILAIIKDKMDIDLDIMDLKWTHRIRKKNGNVNCPRVIIAKFTFYRIRSLVFNNKKCLKKTGIVVREDLINLHQKALMKAYAVFGKNGI